MARRTPVLLFALMALIVSVAIAGPGDKRLGRCLPTSGEISGWNVVGDSYRYGEGSGTHDIYNGDAIVNSGLDAACSQSYKNNGNRITVYCNEFNSRAKSKSWYDDHTTGSGWNSVSVSESGKYKVVSSTVVGHLYRGQVHARIVVYGTGDSQISALKSFMQKVSSRVGQNY
jgi:hypothetical protein